jgi:hypothetical protein
MAIGMQNAKGVAWRWKSDAESDRNVMLMNLIRISCKKRFFGVLFDAMEQNWGYDGRRNPVPKCF